MTLDDHGAEVLVHNIVRQAVQDWRNAKRRLRRNRNNVFALATVDECERFFKSEYFATLTGMDGNTFLDKLKQQLIWKEHALKTRKKKKGEKHDG